MKTRKELIIGGSRGIGAYVIKQRVADNDLINFSRTPTAVDGVAHHEVDVLKSELPAIEALDTLVYLPGSINLKPFTSLSDDDFRNDFEINTMGAIKVIRKYLPVLKKSDDPCIVLFSTVAVTQGMPFHASVSVAKAGIEALVRSLAAEYAPKIRVNGLALNIVDTDLAAKILRNEKIRENIAERQPLKRILEAEEVGRSVSYLIDDAKGMTGQVIGLDLGLSTLRP